MRKLSLALAVALTLFSLVKPGNTDSNSCQTLAVTATDGYVNIRSEPMVKKGNIVGVLPSGSEIEQGSSARFPRHEQVLLETENQSKGWYEIASPFTGWLAGNQIATVDCDRARELLATVGHPAITKFGKQASQGDNAAADTLAKMAPGVDGVTAEIYASAIALWAKEKPCFLIEVLDRQDLTTRYRALYALDFGLGSPDSAARRQFESVIEKQEPNNLTALAWKDIKGDR